VNRSGSRVGQSQKQLDARRDNHWRRTSRLHLEHADDEVLDRYSAARHDTFVNRVSPQATANKRLIYHANGGGRELEEGLASLRRLATDPEFLWQRLMFTKSLETPSLFRVSA